METETEATPWLTRTTLPDEVRVRDHNDAGLFLTLDELQAVVQAAYDQHGILAEPSFGVEAARTAEQSPVDVLTEWQNNAEQRINADHNTGLRAS